MTSFIFAVALAVSTAPNLEAAFGNTIVSTYPSGRSARLWLERDGTYTGRGAKGRPSSGTWSLRGGELCLKQRRPFPAPTTYCSPVPQGAAVGTMWNARSLKDEPLRNRIEAGR